MKDPESVQNLAMAVREGRACVWLAPGAVPFALCQVGAAVAVAICWTSVAHSLSPRLTTPQAAIISLLLALMSVIFTCVFGLMVSRGISSGVKWLRLALIVSGLASISAGVWSFFDRDQTNASVALAGAAACGAVLYGLRSGAYSNFRRYKEVLHKGR